jgi:alkanesulfonate monooxygenase SsuD/methylene tetrahydromethanopterin reductase-like flavin-dependent oxidoreductase (luciferase family)
MTFGVLLPHFGKEASRARIVDGCRLIERLGFDAVWVRDHLLWTPHAHESSDTTFVDALVALAAGAAVTERIVLGTAVLIPIRWPLKAAKELMSLEFIAGPGRVIAGIGAGHKAAELEAAGLDADRKAAIAEETMQIWREAFESESVDFTGEVFVTGQVEMRPKPPAGLPIWYGGTTRAAVRRSARYADGWLPGGTPFATLDARLAYLRSLEAEIARKPCVVGVIPRFQMEKTTEAAHAALDVHALSGASEGSKYWITPEGGFQTIDDLRGIVVAGDADEITQRVGDFDERGVDHFVVDMRSQFERFEELLQQFAEEVMPHFRST